MKLQTTIFALMLLSLVFLGCKTKRHQVKTEPQVQAQVNENVDELVVQTADSLTAELGGRRAYPEWVDAITDSVTKLSMTNPPIKMWRYNYKSELVYYFTAPCCDQFSRLYNGAGELIAYPDGGFTGRGDGRCADFVATRTQGYLLWQDPRAPKSALPQNDD